MSDAANDTISLMMQFGTSMVPAAEHLAEILLDAVQTMLKRGMNLGNSTASQLVDTLKTRVDGLGDHGQIALKNLVKQGRELMVIPVEREDLQTLKSQLKSYQVDFAIQEDALTGDISVHVKAQDLARIEEALKGIIRSTVNEKQADLMATKEALDEDINNSYDFGDTEHAKEAETQLAEVETKLAELSQEGEKNSLRDAGKQGFEFENESYDSSEARASGTIALVEHDWDKTRPDAPKGDERGSALPNGAYEPTMKSEKVTNSGYTLQAYSNGRAAVLDHSGSTVWSACGIAGNIDASKRLADRGLETYQRKESLQLSPQSSERDSQKGDAESFDKKLDKAEATAAIEAGKTMNQGLSRERERNAR